MALETIDSIAVKLNAFNDSTIPAWALLLVESMKAVVSELKTVQGLTQRIIELESYKAINETVSSHLKEENMRLCGVVDKLELKIDDQEQRSRNSCLLFHGIQENEGENTNDVAMAVMNDKLGLGVESFEIQRSHRVGPKNDKRATRSSKPRCRPIIVRYTNYDTRLKVLKNKKLLKGTNTLITESLTSYRYDLFKKAEIKYGKKQVWTVEGKVMTKIDDRYTTINSLEDLSYEL